MRFAKTTLVFTATDFGAYAYHRCLHWIDDNGWHAEHHNDPHDNTIILKASLISGACALASSRSLGVIPIAYWASVTCIHPVLHSELLDNTIVRYIRDRHQRHHDDPRTNYGPYLPFMDWMFGTESPRTTLCG